MKIHGRRTFSSGQKNASLCLSLEVFFWVRGSMRESVIPSREHILFPGWPPKGARPWTLMWREPAQPGPSWEMQILQGHAPDSPRSRAPWKRPSPPSQEIQSVLFPTPATPMATTPAASEAWTVAVPPPWSLSFCPHPICSKL